MPADHRSPDKYTFAQIESTHIVYIFPSSQETIKQKLKGAYADYICWGFPADKVAPLTKDGSNTHSLDTLYIMGLHDEFEDDLLDRAYQLGNKLAYGWANPSQPIPYGYLNFTTNKPVIDTSNIAEAGTLILEFDRLSLYTGNGTFRALADKTMKALMNLPDDFPGLPSLEIYPGNASFVSDYITWGGGVHSYFEYLLKYLEEWKKAVYSSIKHLLTVSDGHTYLAAYSKEQKGRQYVFSHLACFVGGNWILGGKLIGDQTVVRYGLQLIDTCMHSYTSTETGLGPEVFRFVGPNGKVTAPDMTEEDRKFNKKHGFYISNANYVLRPEVLESVFYAWRMTGDERYQEFAWSAFQALNKYCKAAASYAAILDVNNPVNFTQIDDSQSFLYAETFKYLYLTFAPASHFSLDEYFYTRRPCGPGPPERPRGFGNAHKARFKASGRVPSAFKRLSGRLGRSGSRSGHSPSRGWSTNET
ncbi:family 47 glycoside hydrolase [Melampsora americana]|nr:family 47 glycoside hydrolase [Melampsora americana]